MTQVNQDKKAYNRFVRKTFYELEQEMRYTGTPLVSFEGEGICATLSLNFKTGIVCNTNGEAGMVETYRKRNNHWVLFSTIYHPLNTIANKFGWSADLNPNGAILVIGDPSAYDGKGAAYVFIRNKTWVFDKELVATRVGIKGLGADVHVLDDSRTIILKDQSPDPTFECYARMYNGWLSIPPELLGL